MPRFVLFHAPNSSTSMRAYMTWKLKGLQDEVELAEVPKNWSKDAAWLKLNPEGRVPALHIDGKLLTQSWAIMLYLEEMFPNKLSLMPAGPSKIWERAQVHRIAMIFACDTHPLQNLGQIGDAVRNGWMVNAENIMHHPYRQHFLRRSYSALELILAEAAGKYCVGDQMSFADICFACQTR